LKKCIVILLLILIITNTEHTDNKVHTIPDKVYAKGKPKRIKRKTLKTNYEYIGEYTLTAYCGCPRCSGGWGSKTATGTKAKAGRTIAVDPKVIKYGTKVVINGIEYVAEDCGGGIKGKHIDIYFNSHNEALDFGRQKGKVYIKKPPKIIGKLKTIKRYARRLII
jgi:3D (Asp-Asp-Asp) domain-containing protein